MKKVVWTLGMLALTSGIALAQDVNEPSQPAPQPPAKAAASTAGHSALDAALIANERKVNEAVAKGDKAAFTSLVAADAMSADGMGFMKVSDFIAAFDQMKIKTWKMSDEKVWPIDPSTAIVTSTWTGSGTFQGQKIPSKTYCSTVWTKKGDKWVAAYHQESEAVTPPALPKK
ncbi:MAG TPA: nuclear transport factor 2 family protein [Vicinamibacterales bacterium]